MEFALSAIAGDLVGRLISFLVSKYPNHACLEKQQLDRLQQLLLRAHMVVEEADGRYITNSGMLVQLKMLAEAMYRGYHVLDTVQHRHLREGVEEEVSDSHAWFLTNPIKRLRPAAGSPDLDLRSALSDLEDVAENIKEFVILLGASDQRMVRRPYDAYLYVDNFMFGRHTERQHVINILLQRNPPSPTVVPIVGDHLVGKKTLVAHVCNDERVRSYFSSILHLNGEDLRGIDREKFASGRMLIVVNFASDVDDEDWKRLYLSLHKESKVVIICRTESLVRFSTVTKPIRLSTLPHEEYSYLFKKLAFGSADPQDHPRLVLVVNEFAKAHNGSFVGAYSIANVLRSNLNLRFWLCLLNKFRNAVESNYSMYGEHLVLRFKRRSPVDITSLLSPSVAPLRLMPRRSEAEVSSRKLPKVRIADLLGDPTIRPNGDFDLVTWESRMPPYTDFMYFVPSSAEETLFSPRRKRPGLPS